MKTQTYGQRWGTDATAIVTVANGRYKLVKQGYGVKWLRRGQTSLSAIGGEVKGLGKRAMPYSAKLKNSGMFIPVVVIESRDIEGDHTLLISNQAQVKLGIAKDTRAGACKLKGFWR